MKPHPRPPIIRKTVKWGVPALALAICIAGCKGPSYVAKYGSAFNSTRRVNGLPVVPSGWIVEDGSRQIVWHRPNWDGKSGGYQSKDVSINSDGSIRQEQDVFYSGKSFMDVVEGSMKAEKLVITYDYSPRVPGRNRTIHASIAPVGREPDVSDAGGRELTIEEADELLKSWGIDRLAPAATGG